MLSDEIYESLVYDGRRHVSPAAVSADARERTVVINSLSKTYAMTGWRVGYCAGPEAIIRAMFLILQQSSRGPATFVQDAAACALTSDQECVRRMAAEYQVAARPGRRAAARHPGRRAARARGRTLRDGGCPRAGEAVRGRQPYLMRDAGVVVIHGSAYGPGGEGTLRVSFAAGGETLERGLDRLREGLLRLSAGSGKPA